jgi:hypothetical protein
MIAEQQTRRSGRQIEIEDQEIETSLCSQQANGLRNIGHGGNLMPPLGQQTTQAMQ